MKLFETLRPDKVPVRAHKQSFTLTHLDDLLTDPDTFLVLLVLIYE